MTLNQLITDYTARRTAQLTADARAQEERRQATRDKTAATFWRITQPILDAIAVTNPIIAYNNDDHVYLNENIDINGTPAQITIAIAGETPWLKIQLTHPTLSVRKEYLYNLAHHRRRHFALPPTLSVRKEYLYNRAEQFQLNDAILAFFVEYTTAVRTAAQRQTAEAAALANRLDAAAHIKAVAATWHALEAAYQTRCAQHAQTIIDQNWAPWYAWTVRYVPDSLNIVRQLDEDSDLVCTVLAQPMPEPLTFHSRISEHKIVAPGGTIQRMVLGAILDATLAEFTTQPGIDARAPYHHHSRIGNYHINLPPTLAPETLQAIQFDDCPARQHPDWRDYVRQHLPAFADFLTDWRYYADEFCNTDELVNRTPEEIESIWRQQIQDRLPKEQ